MGPISNESPVTVFKGHPAWVGRAKMTDEEVLALQQIVLDHTNISRILEIGSLNGLSTVNLALALERARRPGNVIAIDVFLKTEDRDDESWFDANCTTFGVAHRIRKIKGRLQDSNVLKTLRRERFDLIFHDAES